MAGLVRTHGAPYPLQGGVGGKPAWLVQQQNAVHVSSGLGAVSAATARSISCVRCTALSSVSSKTKARRGACRRPSWRPTAPRRKPPARASPSATCCGSCVPAKGTKKMRAVARSCATSTAVMVTLPTRGSLTSRLMRSASTRCICASMRLCRPALGWCLLGILLNGARDFGARIALDLVADPHVLVVLDANAALGAGTHFAHVILETPQRLQLALEDHHAFT